MYFIDGRVTADDHEMMRTAIDVLDAATGLEISSEFTGALTGQFEAEAA